MYLKLNGMEMRCTGDECWRDLLEKLPDKLKQAAIAREQNPSASLSELAAMMQPPITKPAMNNRMKKLLSMAKEAAK